MKTSKRTANRIKLLPNCGNCGVSLGEFRLDGTLDGKKIAFCSFKCHDIYKETSK